ncbi:sulfotransferase family 2 domain-containing protein [Chroococcidiopsis sp. TS-821]|uniref:sulfotransferase family 2 domain-containing protein n=1 Tax=Chroococcidiopsis sp. TS-821 TaxID=1378066 RepID=UPI000CEF11B4|nr:sulfotransferase family 2 domain-containing protein [Chroococcidiopsis sp. TS-821]PPS40408.1 hypothetical protein B1A85_20335 [Chroococcidiopsis sp. TS-821]
MSTLSKDLQQEQAIIFLHLPKAAGSTLHRIIERQYPANVIYSIDGLKVAESIEEFKNLPIARRQEIKMLKGHMNFGLHEYLPRPSTYITMLREPVERVISLYYYIIRNPKHWLHAEVKGKNLSLQEYVSSGIATAANNGQTRLIAAVDESKVGFDQMSEEHLAIAKQRLQDYFTVVGITEKFDETLILLKNKFGWKMPLYVKENVTKNRQSKASVPPQTLETVEYYNQLDIQLYQYAKQLFEQQISQNLDIFEREFKSFKLINQQYGNVYPIYKYIARKLNVFKK